MLPRARILTPSASDDKRNSLNLIDLLNAIEAAEINRKIHARGQPLRVK
jgi:hypothetical protein